METSSEIENIPKIKYIFYNLACYPSVPTRYEYEASETATIKYCPLINNNNFVDNI